MTQLSAKQLVLERGRGYLYKGKYPQLVIFTRSKTDIDRLIRTYGGNSYKHNSGMIWMLSRRQGLKQLLLSIAGTPSKHGFEKLFKGHLGDWSLNEAM